MNDLHVGRHVWYRPRAHEAGPYPGGQPLAAIVTHVLADGAVNLFVFGMDASTHGLAKVPYFDGDDRPALPGYAEPIPVDDIAGPEKPKRAAKKGAAKENPNSAEE